MKKLLLIDSNAIIHRAYHAIPKTLKNRSGEQTNVVYGFATTLIKSIEDIKPDYIAASFDISKATFRKEFYADYKANRVKADQELYDQIPRVRELLQLLNILVCEKEGYEADDCIGTIVQLCHEIKDLEIYIVTGDKDLFQLVNGGVFVYNLKGGLSQTQIMDRNNIKEIWGLDPADFIDLKALAGDPSDNIPGIPGIGPKTTISLLQKFDSLVGIYKKIDELLPKDQNINEDDVIQEKAKEMDIKPRILRLLIEHREQAFMSQTLATIHREVPIDFALENSKWGDYDRDNLREFFKTMSFNSLLKRFGAEEEIKISSKKVKEQREKDQQLRLL